MSVSTDFIYYCLDKACFKEGALSEYTFGSDRELVDHIYRRHLNASYVCPECGTFWCSYRHLEGHFRDRHRNVYPPNENHYFPTLSIEQSEKFRKFIYTDKKIGYTVVGRSIDEGDRYPRMTHPHSFDQVFIPFANVVNGIATGPPNVAVQRSQSPQVQTQSPTVPIFPNTTTGVSNVLPQSGTLPALQRIPTPSVTAVRLPNGNYTFIPLTTNASLFQRSLTRPRLLTPRHSIERPPINIPPVPPKKAKTNETTDKSPTESRKKDETTSKSVGTQFKLSGNGDEDEIVEVLK